MSSRDGLPAHDSDEVSLELLASAAVGAGEALATQPAAVADSGMEAAGRHVPRGTAPPAATSPSSRDQALVVGVLGALWVLGAGGVDSKHDRYVGLLGSGRV